MHTEARTGGCRLSSWLPQQRSLVPQLQCCLHGLPPLGRRLLVGAQLALQVLQSGREEPEEPQGGEFNASPWNWGYLLFLLGCALLSAQHHRPWNGNLLAPTY